MAASFPTSARIVIIGGGVIGTSIAFHLARSGATGVVLLEKAALTEGATWHAAGLVGQFRSQQNLMSLMSDSVKLFDTLAEETGQGRSVTSPDAQSLPLFQPFTRGHPPRGPQYPFRSPLVEDQRTPTP